MRDYFRPILQSGPARPDSALTLGGGWTWFTDVEVLRRDAPARIIPAAELPEAARTVLCTPRVDIARLSMARPNIMGILNTTPDSFSDGGQFSDLDRALAHAKEMIGAGADMLDIGGESTRPGAEDVALDEETRRTEPTIAALRAFSDVPVSIDTRKSVVARAALDAGADLVNDVAAMTYDPQIAQVTATAAAPICLMHAQGDPQTMQNAPHYDDVLLDVYDFLSERVSAAEAAGIPRQHIMVDPGIGFGKTLDHNLALLQRLSIFHGLGCPILLGVSRKRFIGTLAGVSEAAARMPGSVAVTLAGVAQGAQILRVHDVAETRQALTLFQAAIGD
ncbi:dihydropteroate synthase [Donghicola sp.]|jgi:dihydropteroate synthase|uniref:dihydropteroate synthase n=1 Tax=Donghicola sp. TaxID=1929294 RepID=UPI0025EFACA5|nr:dihydropteroate synthase [Donghicola sp.]MCT4577464.1 dihydropteroate synthase [Donghicola sp.]